MPSPAACPCPLRCLCAEARDLPRPGSHPVAQLWNDCSAAPSENSTVRPPHLCSNPEALQSLTQLELYQGCLASGKPASIPGLNRRKGGRQEILLNSRQAPLRLPAKPSPGRQAVVPSLCLEAQAVYALWLKAGCGAHSLARVSSCAWRRTLPLPSPGLPQCGVERCALWTLCVAMCRRLCLSTLCSPLPRSQPALRIVSATPWPSCRCPLKPANAQASSHSNLFPQYQNPTRILVALNAGMCIFPPLGMLSLLAHERSSWAWEPRTNVSSCLG